MTAKALKEIFLYLLAAIIVAGEITMIIYIIKLWKEGVSTEEANITNLVYGICLAYHSGFMLVLGYFFASSKGSADKNEMIYRSTPLPPQNSLNQKI